MEQIIAVNKSQLTFWLLIEEKTQMLPWYKQFCLQIPWIWSTYNKFQIHNLICWHFSLCCNISKPFQQQFYPKQYIILPWLSSQLQEICLCILHYMCEPVYMLCFLYWCITITTPSLSTIGKKDKTTDSNIYALKVTAGAQTKRKLASDEKRRNWRGHKYP